jgi:Bromodomain/HMG (high mobility group) box
MSSRARRSATKIVNYAKEQDFSDEDLFEDEELLPVKAPPAPRRKTTRKSKDTTPAVVVNESLYHTSRPVYTEKGYDSSLPPPRERFTFMPEYEDDGTLKIELIVGRRPIDETGERQANDESDVELAADVFRQGGNGKLETPINSGNDQLRTTRSVPINHGITQNEQKKKDGLQPPVVEYEYLVKYKGRSYLHLDWKTGADLESMNKSAKGLYSRYLKKLEQSVDEDIENPEFDPSYVVPEKIVDEAEQELTIDLSDKELIRWEKQRERELAMEASEENDNQENESSDNQKELLATVGNSLSFHDHSQSSEGPNFGTSFDIFVQLTVVSKIAHTYSKCLDYDWKEDEEVDYKMVPIERLRAIVNKDGSFYPVVRGMENPYRDGYITEPPKKPRGSYMFFQTAMRNYYQTRNLHAHTQSELMKILGDVWTKMSDEEKDVFVQLSNEEAKQYDKQKELLDKAQKANGVWQPLRRCEKVLDRISSDAFAEVFLEPVDTHDFPDYEDVIDQPMDLATVKKKLGTKKYQACEQFARDVRKVSL